MRFSLTEVTRLIGEALGRHKARSPMEHPDGSVKARHLGVLDYITLTAYTDATRPAASSVPAGTVIYNSDDGGINVSDGTNWKGPSGGWVTT